MRKLFLMLLAATAVAATSCKDDDPVLLPESIAVEGVDGNSYEMLKATTFQISPSVTPAGLDPVYTYTGMNNTVAEVSETGLITANESGTALIRIGATANGVTITKDLSVTVYANVEELSVAEGKESIIMVTGSSVDLFTDGYFVVVPADARNTALGYSSDDTGVVTVDANGVLRGVAAGMANVTATTTDGTNLSVSIPVIVTDDPYPVIGAVTEGDDTWTFYSNPAKAQQSSYYPIFSGDGASFTLQLRYKYQTLDDMYVVENYQYVTDDDGRYVFLPDFDMDALEKPREIINGPMWLLIDMNKTEQVGRIDFGSYYLNWGGFILVYYTKTVNVYVSNTDGQVVPVSGEIADFNFADFTLVGTHQFDKSANNTHQFGLEEMVATRYILLEFPDSQDDTFTYASDPDMGGPENWRPTTDASPTAGIGSVVIRQIAIQ